MRAAWTSVAALAAALALSACTEKPQTASQRKSDQAPYATASGAYTAGNWKEGDSKAWERQLNTRAQNGQNEYSRATGR